MATKRTSSKHSAASPRHPPQAAPRVAAAVPASAAAPPKAPVRAAPKARVPTDVRTRERSAALLKAAFSCFAEGGFHETTVDDICRKAGVSKGSFYWYFESKEQVFVQILEVWAEEVEGEIMAQFRDAFADKEPQQALLLALGREGRRGRRLLPVWLDALVQSQRHPELKKAMSHFMQRMRRALAGVVAPTFGAFYSEQQIDTLAGLLLASFIGSIAQDMAEPGNDIYDEQSRMLLVTVEHFGRLLAEAPPD